MRVGVGIGVVNAGMVRGGNMKAPVATARVVGDGVKNSMPVDSLSTTRSKIGSQNRNSNYVLSLLIRNTHTHTHKCLHCARAADILVISFTPRDLCPASVLV